LRPFYPQTTGHSNNSSSMVRIPALVAIPFAMADLYAVLAVIAFVERIVERRRSV